MSGVNSKQTTDENTFLQDVHSEHEHCDHFTEPGMTMEIFMEDPHPARPILSARDAAMAGPHGPEEDTELESAIPKM